MGDKRRIVIVDHENASKAIPYFQNHTGVNFEKIRPRMEKPVRESRDAIDSLCSVKMVFERVSIASREADCITLESGQKLVGEMIQKVLADSNEVYLFVVCVDGFADFSSDDAMTDYFGDMWATSLQEYALSVAAEIMSDEVAAEGKGRTYIWCPGQTSIDIENQTAIFDLLHPEDIGCTLTDTLAMKPAKSSSGIVGITPDQVEDRLYPCDFCDIDTRCAEPFAGCAVI